MRLPADASNAIERHAVGRYPAPVTDHAFGAVRSSTVDVGFCTVSLAVVAPGARDDFVTRRGAHAGSKCHNDTCFGAGEAAPEAKSHDCEV